MSLFLPVGPKSVRVFAGYRLPSLARETFFKELGDTFMPGTPYMLAPLGLAGYVAAVLDLDPALGLPDEVALIVYASVDAYRAARQDSLQGRMYTHSHAGVFDMAQSRGQFPGSESAPDKLAPSDRWAWAAFDDALVDWQRGSTRLVFVDGAPKTGSMQDAVLAATKAARSGLATAGVDQLIVLTGPKYAAMWLHSAERLAQDSAGLKIVPEGARVQRDLVATPVPIRTGAEGVPIGGPAAFSFRFVRDLHFFL